MLHIRQAREADKPAIEAMYERRVRYNDAHGIHQWNPDEVSWEAFSKLYTIADYYVGTVNEKVVCGLFIVDEDALYCRTWKRGHRCICIKSVWTPLTAEMGMRMP